MWRICSAPANGNDQWHKTCGCEKEKKMKKKKKKKNGGILLNHYEYGSADDVTVSLANRRQCSS